ncbi:ribonuclease P protein component [Candidatus Microgenomates bacterium]|nr:ribonuclease P protein component [Candidatus Microgenomates bacterium]
MLPKKNRLPLQDGLLLKNKKLVWQGQLFNIFIQRDNSVLPRLSIIVSKKIAASSVARHKIKRRLVEAIRPYLKILPQLKILIYAKKEITRATFSTIKEEVIVGVKLTNKTL